MAVISTLYIRSPAKHGSWHSEVIPLLFQFDTFIQCFDFQNKRYRLGDFDLCRILWLNIIMLLLNFMLISIAFTKLRNSLCAAVMLTAGTFIGYSIYPSEVRLQESVKTPIVFLFVMTFVLPQFVIHYSRFFRYEQYRIILESDSVKQEF